VHERQHGGRGFVGAVELHEVTAGDRVVVVGPPGIQSIIANSSVMRIGGL